MPYLTHLCYIVFADQLHSKLFIYLEVLKMLLESSPFALLIFIFVFWIYDTILEKINFPVPLLSKDLFKRKLQAILFISVFWVIVLFLRSLNIRMNEVLYYYVYFPLAIVVLKRVISVIFKI